MSDIVRDVATRAGQPIAFRTEATGQVEVSMTLDAADPDALLQQFARALDRHNIALLRHKDPARGWYLVAYARRAAPAAAPADDAPFVVRVVEGRVMLGGDFGAVAVAAGEEGAVTVAGRLDKPRRLPAARAVAAWRTDAAAPALAADAPSADGTTLTLNYRVLGTTEDGQTIVEYAIPGRDPQRAVLEDGTLPVPLGTGQDEKGE